MLQYLGFYGEHKACPILALRFSPPDYPFTLTISYRRGNVFSAFHFTLFCTKISRSHIHLLLWTIPTILLMCLMDVEPRMFLTKWHKPLD